MPTGSNEKPPSLRVQRLCVWLYRHKLYWLCRLISDDLYWTLVSIDESWRTREHRRGNDG